MLSFDELKKKRIEEKNAEYSQAGISPYPQTYSLETLLQHFFAEVGKFQHAFYHAHADRRIRGFYLFQDLADVSNLHDFIVKKINAEIKRSQRKTDAETAWKELWQGIKEK
jgi:hypothetical protein